MCIAILAAVAAIGLWFLTFWFWPGGDRRALRLPVHTLVWAILAVTALLAAVFLVC